MGEEGELQRQAKLHTGGDNAGQHHPASGPALPAAILRPHTAALLLLGAGGIATTVVVLFMSYSHGKQQMRRRRPWPPDPEEAKPWWPPLRDNSSPWPASRGGDPDRKWMTAGRQGELGGHVAAGRQWLCHAPRRSRWVLAPRKSKERGRTACPTTNRLHRCRLRRGKVRRCLGKGK